MSITGATLVTDDGTVDVTEEFQPRGRLGGKAKVTVTVVEPEFEGKAKNKGQSRPSPHTSSGRVIDADFRDKA